MLRTRWMVPLTLGVFAVTAVPLVALVVESMFRVRGSLGWIVALTPLALYAGLAISTLCLRFVLELVGGDPRVGGAIVIVPLLAGLAVLFNLNYVVAAFALVILEEHYFGYIELGDFTSVTVEVLVYTVPPTVASSPAIISLAVIVWLAYKAYRVTGDRGFMHAAIAVALEPLAIVAVVLLLVLYALLMDLGLIREEDEVSFLLFFLLVGVMLLPYQVFKWIAAILPLHERAVRR